MIKDIIELLEKLAKIIGIPDWLVNTIVFSLIVIFLIGIAIFIVKSIWNGIKSFVLWKNQKKLNKDLHPYFTGGEIYRATKYYIPTRFQKTLPYLDDKQKENTKSCLIQFFLKQIFESIKNDDKYFIILADTGMGKTTFLINLYITYKNKIRFFTSPRYEIKMFPLGYPDIINEIEKIENKENTILLLDAFDEDIKAIENHKARMKEILKVVEKFRDIVITCRTQFFPSEEEEPYNTGYYSFGDKGEYKFQKLYLSVFSDNDVKKYLKKLFFIFKNRNIAKKIVKKIPNLTIRPMLLSHIEDLIKSNRTYEYSFQIYEELIKKWIERESSKLVIKDEHGSEENYRVQLMNFSLELAIDLYKNREKRKGYFITKDDKYGVDIALKLSKIVGDDNCLTETDIRSKSLLNRGADGKYKFSHKSIMEYFLAKKMIEDSQFYIQFDFYGMDAAKQFFIEMVVEKLKEMDGIFYLFDGNIRREFLDNLSPKNYLEIIEIEITGIRNINLLYLSYLPKVQKLILFDKKKYNILYSLYILFLFENQQLQDRIKEAERRYWFFMFRRMNGPRIMGTDVQDLWVQRESLKQIQLREVSKLQKFRVQIQLQELLNQLEWFELQELRERILQHEPLKLLEEIDWLEFQELLDQLKQFGWLELQEMLNQKDQKIITQLTQANDFLLQVKELKKHLPVDCKLIY